MKKLITIAIVLTVALAAIAQAPQKMSYQCVIRSTSGALVISHAVGLRISILQGSASGTAVFSETYSPVPQTNANGLLTIEIGSGTASTGNFSSIDWSSGPYYLKTETDPDGGTNYTITGTSQLLSVPYALYAKSAANGFSGNYNDLLNKPSLFSGNYNDLLNKPSLFSGNYNDLTNKPILFDGTWASLTGKPTLFDGTWTSLTGKPAGFADGIDNVDDADNSITNEIQALSLSGTVLTLSNGGGSVTLPSAAGLTLPYSGSGTGALTHGVFEVTDDRTTGGGAITSGLAGISKSSDGVGVYGQAEATSGPASGVLGITSSSSGSGVFGQGLGIGVKGSAGSASIAKTYGVYGRTTSSEGYGVYGTAYYAGVKGFAEGTTGARFGVFGESESSGGYGVYGHASATAGANFGVYGKTLSSDGCGVKGWATATSGINYGVYGETASDNGYGVYGKSFYRGVSGISTGGGGAGVYGENTATGFGVSGKGAGGVRAEGTETGITAISTKSSGSSYGVFAQVNSTEGTAVQGQGLSETGFVYGVRGITSSPDGTGVRGESPRYAVYGVTSASTGRALKGEAMGTASIGVYGVANNTSSTGVWGEGANQGVYGTSPSSTGKGVYGQIASATGYSGYFEGGKFYVSSDVGINTTSPTQALDVNGNARFRSIASDAYYGVLNRKSDGTLTTATSDIHFKENVETLQNSLSRILQLRGVTFTWKNNPEYGTRIGFIAQEFEKVIPELVFTNETDGYKGINYAEVSAVLVEAVKEQQKQIEELKSEIELLKKK